jgi:hypothetical protein
MVWGPWTGLIRIRTEAGGGHCECGCVPPDSTKCGEFQPTIFSKDGLPWKPTDVQLLKKFTPFKNRKFITLYMNLSHWNISLTGSIQNTSSLLVRISVVCTSVLSSGLLADLRNNPTKI